jgi:hypothetical protein
MFVAYMSNGTQLNFYTSVTGADKGVIKTNVGSDGNAGMVDRPAKKTLR